MSETDNNQANHPFETYPQAIAHLLNSLPLYWRVGLKAYKPGLDNATELCNILGNPQNSFKSIHVAGTNGKGSTSHMLASILQHAGYKVGLFTSPHLKDIRERIKINGEMIPEQSILDFTNRYYESFKNIQPSFFEWIMTIAFEYFSDSKVDVAIIEAGVGGRLDSTNIVKPVLSVITNIGIDHVQILGNTLESIATEKAGIIKPGIPIVIGEYTPETAEIFRQKAEQNSSRIRFASAEYSVTKSENNNGFLNLDIEKPGKPYLPGLKIDLVGRYQNKNVLTTLCAIEELAKHEYKISEQAIRDGLAHAASTTGLSGRWQTLATKPLTICDVGHNTHGFTEIVKQINQTPHEYIHFIFGMVNDKDITAVLELLPKTAKYYFCGSELPRVLNADELKAKAQTFGLKGESFSSATSALTAAQNNATPNDLIFIGGSFFVVGEILQNRLGKLSN